MECRSTLPFLSMSQKAYFILLLCTTVFSGYASANYAQMQLTSNSAGYIWAEYSLLGLDIDLPPQCQNPVQLGQHYPMMAISNQALKQCEESLVNRHSHVEFYESTPEYQWQSYLQLSWLLTHIAEHTQRNMNPLNKRNPYIDLDNATAWANKALNQVAKLSKQEGVMAKSTINTLIYWQNALFRRLNPETPRLELDVATFRALIPQDIETRIAAFDKEKRVLFDQSIRMLELNIWLRLSITKSQVLQLSYDELLIKRDNEALIVRFLAYLASLREQNDIVNIYQLYNIELSTDQYQQHEDALEWRVDKQPAASQLDSDLTLSVKLRSAGVHGSTLNEHTFQQIKKQLTSFESGEIPPFFRFSALHLQAALLDMMGNVRAAERYFNKAQTEAIQIANRKNSQIPEEMVFVYRFFVEKARNLYQLEKTSEAAELLSLFPLNDFRQDDLLFVSAVLIEDGQAAQAEKLLNEALITADNDTYQDSYRHNLTIALFRQGKLQLSLEQLMLLETVAKESNNFHLPTYQLSIALLQSALGQRDEAKNRIMQLLAKGDISQSLLLSNLEALYITPDSEPMQLNQFYPALVSRVYMVREGYHQGMVISSTSTLKNASAAQLVVYSDSDNGQTGFVHASQLSLAQDSDLAVTSVAGGSVWLFQPSSGRAIRKIRLSNGNVLKLQLSADGATLFALIKEQNSFRSYLQRWDLQHDQMTWSSGEEVGEVADFDWLETKNRLLVLDQASIDIYDTSNFNKIDRFEHSTLSSGIEHLARPYIGKFTTNNKIVIGFESELVSWDLNSGAKQITALPSTPKYIARTDSNHMLQIELVKSSWDSPEIILYFDSETLTEITENDSYQGQFTEKNSTTNEWVRITKAESGYSIYRRSDNQLINQLRARNRQVLQSTLFEDQKLMVLRTTEGIQLWSLETGRQLPTGEHLNHRYSVMEKLDNTHLLLVSDFADNLTVLNLKSLTLDSIELNQNQKPTDLIKVGATWWLLSDNGYVGSQKRLALAQLTWTDNRLHYQEIASDLEYQALNLLTGYQSSTGFSVWLMAELNNDQFQLLTIAGDANSVSIEDNLGILPLTKSPDFGYSNINVGNVIEVIADEQKLSLLTESGWLRIDLTNGVVSKEQEQLGRVAALLMPPNSDEQFRVVRAASRSFIVNERDNNEPFVVLNDSISDMRYSDNGEYLTAITSDQNLLFLDPETFEPIVSLMLMEKNGWLVTDQEGRYDSSAPGDIPNASWIVKSKPLIPLPLENFMQEYYEPALLVRALNFEAFPETMDLQSIDTRQPVIGFERLISNNNGTVTINLTIDSNDEGVDSIQLFRNNQLVGRVKNIDHPGRQIVTFSEIQLPSSSGSSLNKEPIEFSAYAFNRQGIRTPVLVIPYQAVHNIEREKRAYVITVGVNQYNNASWDLTYAANDALEMQQRLTSSSLIEQGYNVIPIPLTSDHEFKNATKATITKVMQRLAGEDIPMPEINGWENIIKATPDDLILFSFSGHGLLAAGEFYFFTSDIAKGDSREINSALLQSALSSTEFTHLLESVDVGTMVMIVDACQSAGALDSKGFKPGPMGSRGLGQLAWDKKMFYLSASQAEQFALESDQLNHGYLSYSLAKEGLASGQADYFPENNEISVREWLSYGVKRVPELVNELRSGEFSSLQSNTRGLGAAPTDMNAQTALGKIQQPVLFDFAGQRDIALQQLNN